MLSCIERYSFSNFILYQLLSESVPNSKKETNSSAYTFHIDYARPNTIAKS